MCLRKDKDAIIWLNIIFLVLPSPKNWTFEGGKGSISTSCALYFQWKLKKSKLYNVQLTEWNFQCHISRSLESAPDDEWFPETSPFSLHWSCTERGSVGRAENGAKEWVFFFRPFHRASRFLASLSMEGRGELLAVYWISIFLNLEAAHPIIPNTSNKTNTRPAWQITCHLITDPC